MKKIEFTRPMVVEPEVKIRNGREALIADIVNATQEKDKKKLAKMLAIATNTNKWTNDTLHSILSKRRDPKIRNYTAYVWWAVKIKNTPTQSTASTEAEPSEHTSSTKSGNQ